MPSKKDYYVPFLREETIANTALLCRREADNENLSYFNITDYVRFVQRVVSKSWKKGPLHIEFYDASENGDPASVTFNPLTLHVDREIWKLADHGDPRARYIIAHEIGHIMLHDHYAQSFSDSSAVRIKYAVEGNSAEWQANTFAAHFLLPGHIVAATNCVGSLTQSCGVPRQLAQDRVVSLSRAKSRSYSGQGCPDCGNFTVVANGAGTKCDTCGATTEWPWRDNK